MQQEPFDRWLRDAAQSYHQPPSTDLDSLWSELEQRRDGEMRAHMPHVAPRRAWWAHRWLQAAAILVVGIGLGRVSALPVNVSPSLASVRAVPGETVVTPALDAPDAEKYLAQTVALLASLQTDTRTSQGDTLLATRAIRLLSTTRFLLDSPAGDDPGVRTLLEDLELVLVQIVQIPSSRSTSDVELIHQAMQQRDVMPRLRTAVANLNSAD